VPASAAALLLGLLAGAAAHRLLSREGPPPIPSLSRLTFRRGTIEAARFSPDGQVVYGAFWDGAPVELFFARPGSPESRPLGFSNTELLALSRSGELALSLGRRRVGTFVGTGTLAQAPLAGGAPREVQEDVQLADWSPSGGLAVVRSVAGRNRLEHPIGTVLFETSGWVSDPRVSPSGDRIAFVDHPVWGDDGGNVAVVDLAGNVRRLTRDWNSLQGLAWSPRGDEVWFTGTRQGAARALNAVALDGSERALARMAGTLTLHDVQQNGRALVSHQVLRREMRALAPGAAEERDLSWLDYAYPSDFSDDGSTIFFAENGEGGGRGYSVYVRHSDGSPAVRLGVGAAMAMSPDRKLVFANQNYTSDEQRWMLIPTGPGQPRTLDRGSVRAFAASFFPGGERLAIVGSEPGRPTRVYVLDVASGGPPKPIAAEGTSFPLSGRPVSPEGRWLALRVADGSHAAHPVDGGTPRPLRGIGPDEQVIRWSAAGEALYVYRPGEIPAVVVRVDPATGRRDVVKRIQPADRAGVVAVTPVLLTPDAASYVYGFRRVLSDLYVVEGLR
jgi:Tol biopolymer transport system component